MNLHGLEQLAEYPDQEINIAERLERAFSQMYEEAQLIQNQDLDLIYRQLTFIRAEIKQIRGRRILLSEAHETLTGAIYSFNDKLADAKQELKD